jgi:hypothetical protein
VSDPPCRISPWPSLTLSVGIGSAAAAFSEPYPQAAGKIMLGFLCFGAALIQFGPTGDGWTYMGESGSLRLRAKTTVFGALGNGIVGVVYNVAIPYMLTGNAFGVKGSCFWLVQARSPHSLANIFIQVCRLGGRLHCHHLLLHSRLHWKVLRADRRVVRPKDSCAKVPDYRVHG